MQKFHEYYKCKLQLVFLKITALSWIKKYYIHIVVEMHPSMFTSMFILWMYDLYSQSPELNPSCTIRRWRISIRLPKTTVRVQHQDSVQVHGSSLLQPLGYKVLKPHEGAGLGPKLLNPRPSLHRRPNRPRECRNLARIWCRMGNGNDWNLKIKICSVIY